MTPRITILDDYQDVARSSADWSVLAARFELDVITTHIADADELVERLGASTIVVAMRERTPLPERTLARLPGLKLLVTTGAKNASIDLDAARRLGITVCGTQSGVGNPMPELTIGLMIALGRHFVAEDRAVRAGGWQHTVGMGLAGRTLGIVGLGRLGRGVATLAHAFGMTVIAWSPHLTGAAADEVGVRAVGKAELFETADFVTIHLALAESTRGLIGAGDLARMQPHAYLINTSRGPIVDEVALIDALTRNRIAGAGLDVYDTEPLPVDHPLRALANTVLLPHIGYVTTDNYAVFFRDTIEDILAFAAGRAVRELQS